MSHSLPCVSRQYDFYRVGLSTSRLKPNLEGQASVFVTPGDRVTQLYPQALGTHFSHLLQRAWAMLGLFLSSSHHMENKIIPVQQTNMLLLYTLLSLTYVSTRLRDFSIHTIIQNIKSRRTILT
jgi:hypothetical protein